MAQDDDYDISPDSADFEPDNADSEYIYYVDPVMAVPPCDSVIGRRCSSGREELYTRSGTGVAICVQVPFLGANHSGMQGTLFYSASDKDSGGVVLRLETDAYDDENFIPFARNIARGVEIHMAGDGEGDALIKVLRALVAGIEDRRSLNFVKGW